MGKPRVDLETRRYFEVADRTDLSDADKLDRYLAIADDYLDADHYREWCAKHLGHFDAAVLAWFQSDTFSRLLQATVDSTYPAHERAKFMGHFGGRIALWVKDETARLDLT